MRRVLLTILLLLIPGFLISVVAQEYRQKLNSLFNQLRHAPSDIAKVDLLCQISRFYQHELPKPRRELDSALAYGKQAQVLSKKLHYTKGYWAALDCIFDSYALMYDVSKAFGVIDNIYDTHVVKMLYSSAIVYQGSIWRKPNKDSALIFYRKALMVSEKTGNEYFICESKIRLISCYAAMGDTIAAQREMRSFERDNKPLYVAAAWHAIGDDVSETAGYLSFKLSSYQRSLDLYTAQGDKMHAGEVLLDIGGVYDEQGNPARAEQYYLEAVTLLKQAKYPKIHKAYVRLHDLYYYRGDLDKAVYYSLEAARSAERYGVKDFRYLFLHNDSSNNGPKQVEKKSYTYAAVLKGTVMGMIKEGRKQEALDYTLAAINRAPNYGKWDNMIHAELMGICYTAMGRLKDAEQYYLQMMEYARSLKEHFAAQAPFAIGSFYYETGQYTKAIPFLQQYLQYPRQYTAATDVSEAHLFLYRIDSARHDNNSALQHFRTYKEITDSIFSAAKSRQIAELRLQYDIEKKDQTLLLQQKDIELLTKQKLLQQSLAEQQGKDVLLKQQNIDLLTQQQSLQEMVTNRQQRELDRKEKDLLLQQENIGLLRNREQLQESQLKQANFIKRMTIGGIVLLLIIVALLYNQYRVKLRNSRRVSEQNGVLHNLLEEKEWLLKEVHHRVKNNLQVVLSLLQSQSVYLKDEALAAVHDSQHRIQAMSLIHQKLYQSDNISSINMDVYIPELVDYLKDSFVTRTRIVFVMNIAPVALDVTQAIPLGLIINEAVTNIFKHAFPRMERGQVHISLQELNTEELMLDIRDNGVGLPAGHGHSPASSLGLNLMKGLCRDFHGRYSIEGRDGTHIRIVFNRYIYQPASSSTLQPTSYGS